MTKWLEQKDATRWVRLGALKKDDDTELTYLLPIEGTLEGTIKNTWKAKDEDSSPGIGLEILNENKEPETVKMSLPSRLATGLGLNPDWAKKHQAKVGSVVRIVYHGQDDKAKGNPHLFDVYFATP